MRRLRQAAAAVLVMAALPGTASGASVGAGSLDWTQYNVYVSGGPRTWMGYTTTPTAPFTNGAVTASAGATGPTVNGASPRGSAQNPTSAAFSHGFAAVGGDYDKSTRRGTIEFRGTVTFSSVPHGFTITVTEPQVVLDGAGGGALYATGETPATGAGNGRYDRSKPVFTLDASAAKVDDDPDGSRTISGLAPAIAANDWAFPGGERGYPQGAGPDRNPNTFGTFAVRIAFGKAAKEGGGSTGGGSTPTGSSGGSTGTSATGRVRGKTEVSARDPRKVRVALARPIADRAVTVRLNRGGRTWATGRASGRTLSVTVKRVAGRRTIPALKGVYSLRAAGAATVLNAASVRLSR